VFLRKSLGLLSLLVLIGLISLSFTDSAFAQVESVFDPNTKEITVYLGNSADYSVELSDLEFEELLPDQTTTAKKLLMFYHKNQMINDFGGGKLTDKFISQGTVKFSPLNVVAHTEAEKAKTIIVNTNYEIIKSYSEVFTPEDYDYLEFVNELPNEISLAIILGPLTLAAVFLNRDRRLEEESSAVKIISRFFVMIVLVTGLGFAFPAVIAQSYWGVPFADAEEQDIDQAEQDFSPLSSEKDSAQQSLLPEAKESIQFDNSDKDNQSLHGDLIIVTDDNPYLNLDGDRDYVKITSSELPNKLQSLTVSAWVKPNYDQGSSEMYIVSKDKAFSLSINNVIYPEKKVAFSVFDGIKWHKIISKSDVKPDQWNFITATFADSSISIYLNGFKENSLSLKDVVSKYYNENGKYRPLAFDKLESDSLITIGAYTPHRDNEYKVKHQYAGLIDDVQLFDVKLSQAQISEIYDNQRLSIAPIVSIEKEVPEEQVTSEFAQYELLEPNQFAFVADKEQSDSQEIEEEASQGFAVKKEEKKKKPPIQQFSDDTQVTPGSDTPTEGTTTEDTSSDYVGPEDTPTESTPTEDIPIEDTPTESTPTEDIPIEDTPTESTPTEDTTTEDTSSDYVGSDVQQFSDDTQVTPSSDTSTEPGIGTEETVTQDTPSQSTKTDKEPEPPEYEEDQSDDKFLKKLIKVSPGTKKSFSNLPDAVTTHGKWKLYGIVDGEKIDYTDDPEVLFTLLDSDGDGIEDEAKWNVPEGITEFYVEAEIVIINIQSFPSVGGTWEVFFDTTGEANLIITAVDGTQWSDYSEEASDDIIVNKIKKIDKKIDKDLKKYNQLREESVKLGDEFKNQKKLEKLRDKILKEIVEIEDYKNQLLAIEDTTALENNDLIFLEIKCGEDVLPYQWDDNSVIIKEYSCEETGSLTSKVLTSGEHHLEFRFANDVGFAHNLAGDAVDLRVTKSVTPTLAKIGQTVTYTIHITNLGPSDATGVELFDSMSSGTATGITTISQGTFDLISGIWDVGLIANGKTAVLRFTAEVPTGASGTFIDNTARITGLVETDTNDANDFDRALYFVTANVPIALDDTITTPEESPVTIDVLANDSDVDGDTILLDSFDATTTNGGTITRDINGTPADTSDDKLIYSPALDFNGSDTFTYTINDGTGRFDTATVTVDVTPVNDDPVAADDSRTTPEDTPLTVDVLANDSDVDGDNVLLDSFDLTSVNGGTITRDDNTTPADTSDDMLIYNPALDFNGIDTFTYTIADGNSGFDTATVTVNVTTVNDNPDAADDTATTPEENTVTIDVLANDSDVEGDTVLLDSFDAASANGGTITRDDNGTPADTSDDKLIYNPAANFSGTDTFTYTIADGNGGFATATVTVNVTTVNDNPNAADDTTTTPEDTQITIDVLFNDSDVDGDPIVIDSFDVISTSGGTIVLDNNATPLDPTDDKLIYNPALNFNGLDTFTYTISDGALTDTATVTVDVIPVNDAPVAVDDTATTPEDTSVTVNVLACHRLDQVVLHYYQVLWFHQMWR